MADRAMEVARKVADVVERLSDPTPVNPDALRGAAVSPFPFGVDDREVRDVIEAVIDVVVEERPND